MKLAYIAAGLLGMAACSHSRLAPRAVEPPDSEEREDARAAEKRSAALQQELLALTAGQATPECHRVCELIEQICHLSQRICLIAGRHRDDPELADRCTAGEQRCHRSRDRAPAGCLCQAR
jgi:hypothetical protein